MNYKTLLAPAAVLALAACATAKPVDNTSSTVPASSAGVGSANSSRWSASLQPSQQRTGGLGPTGQNKTFGNVSIIPAGPERIRMSISLSTPLQNSTSLNWAILPGRCGGAALPLVAVERFPVIEVSTNGRGTLNSEMALLIPNSGTYHVNVYWAGGGTQLSDVMTCGTLKRDG
ncbi:MAG: hypothetical protein ABIS03_08880 [Gemmatimonadaceae bacterium]